MVDAACRGVMGAAAARLRVQPQNQTCSQSCRLLSLPAYFTSFQTADLQHLCSSASARVLLLETDRRHRPGPGTQNTPARYYASQRLLRPPESRRSTAVKLSDRRRALLAEV